MTKSFVDEAEEIVDIVADWAEEIIEDAVSRLSTKGRPFMQREKSEAEQLKEYMTLLSSPDPQASFLAYIDGKARDIITRLINSGVPEEEIVTIHPYDIAARHTIIWSAEMEALRAKMEASYAVPAPTEPTAITT